MIYRPTEDETRRNLVKFSYYGKTIPSYMHDGLVSYFHKGVLPGAFLLAMLENNLSRACYEADDVNLWILPVYHTYLYNCAPSNAWGSKEKVRKWVEPFIKAREEEQNVINLKASLRVL